MPDFLSIKFSRDFFFALTLQIKRSRHKYLFIFSSFGYFHAVEKHFLWEKSETDGAWKVDAIKMAHQTTRVNLYFESLWCWFWGGIFYDVPTRSSVIERHIGLCLMENIQIISIIYDTFNLGRDLEASHLNFCLPQKFVNKFQKIIKKWENYFLLSDHIAWTFKGHLLLRSWAFL